MLTIFGLQQIYWVGPPKIFIFVSVTVLCQSLFVFLTFPLFGWNRKEWCNVVLLTPRIPSAV